MSKSPTATHVCLVLDRSGSMQSVREDALGSVNSYIQTAKQDRDLYESRFSMITFSSEGIDIIRKNEIMETVKPIGTGEYVCNGLTPLYDAVGRGIGVLDEALEGKPGRAILVVMTDGLENHSREFSHETITSLIKARQERGWMVTFLGEGLDVARQGMAMGAMYNKVAHYAPGEGLRSAGRVMASLSKRYVGTRGDIRRAALKAALLPAERDALAGKKTKKK